MIDPVRNAHGARRLASGARTGTALWLCLQLYFPISAGGQQAQAPAPQAAPQAPAPQLQPLAGGDLPAVVARIDGEEISRQELLAQAETMRLQEIQAGAGDPAQSEQFLPMVLDALINERLVYTDFKTRDAGPSEAEIDQQVQAVIKAYGGEEGFEKALEKQGLDRQYVRRQMAQTLSFDRMMEQEIKPAIEIGEDAVTAYYERNKEQLKMPTLYKLRRIVKQLPAGADAEAKAAARAQLEAWRQQVLGGTDFAALAKEHSDDAATRDQGGELPWFPLTGRGGRLESVIAQLEIGQTSEVIETGVAMLLLRAEDSKPERIKTLDEAREEIVNILAAVKAREVIRGRVERLRTAAKVEILM